MLKMISSGVKSLYFVIIVIMEWWKLYLTRKPCCLAELQLYHLKYCNNFPADINISWLTWDSDIISVVGTLLTVICGSDPKWRVVSCISLLCCIIIVFSSKYNEARGVWTDSLFIIVTLWHCDTTHYTYLTSTVLQMTCWEIFKVWLDCKMTLSWL